MFSIVKSMSLDGLEGYLVEVQTDISAGLPSFNVVGLPDTSIKEAKERVRTSIKNSNFEIPSRKILVNLAPADKRKEGTIFDLPIAVGILMAMGEIKQKSMNEYDQTVFIGELSLDGKINKVKGVLPMCIEARNLGIKRIIVPESNSGETAVIEGLEIIPVSSLNEMIEYLNGSRKIERKMVNIDEIFRKENKYNVDFNEVKGQENVKRALEIAVSGGHNCLLIGSPRRWEKYDS